MMLFNGGKMGEHVKKCTVIDKRASINTLSKEHPYHKGFNQRAM